MSVFRSIFLSLGGLSLAGGYYLSKQKVSLENQHLRSILSLLHNYNQNYSSLLLKQMIRFQMIGRCQQVQNYVLSYGFYFQAWYIDGLNEIGFDTIEFGPVSLMPSVKQEKRTHFGNKMALSNINVFRQKQKQIQNKNNQQTKNKNKNSKIGVVLSPNFQVLRYAPYLIEENIINCFKQFQELNQTSQTLFVDRYVIKLNQPDMIQLNTPQYLTMVKQLIKNINQTTLITLEAKKKNFPSLIEKLQRPQILIEVPNSQQNKQVFKTVQQLPIVQKMIIDGSEYELSRSTQKVNKKTTQNVIKLTVGKKRITFQQLLDKIITDTL